MYRNNLFGRDSNLIRSIISQAAVREKGPAALIFEGSYYGVPHDSLKVEGFGFADIYQAIQNLREAGQIRTRVIGLSTNPTAIVIESLTLRGQNLWRATQDDVEWEQVFKGLFGDL